MVIGLYDNDCMDSSGSFNYPFCTDATMLRLSMEWRLPELEVLLVFFAAAITLGLAPGPDNIFVLTQSALYGRLAGLVVTLGLCTGLLFHTTAVALGIATVFSTSPIAFNIVKLVGAAYLLYLAWQALKAGKSDLSAKERVEPSLRQLYRRGIVMNVANPKVAIFFLAFLPQFADPEIGPLAPQLFILGCLFMVSTVCVFGLVAWGAGFLGEWLKRSASAQLILNRIAAVVFVGLATRLVVAQR